MCLVCRISLAKWPLSQVQLRLGESYVLRSNLSSLICFRIGMVFAGFSLKAFAAVWRHAILAIAKPSQGRRDWLWVRSRNDRQRCTGTGKVSGWGWASTPLHMFTLCGQVRKMTWQVILAGRSEGKGKEALEELLKRVPNAKARNRNKARKQRKWNGETESKRTSKVPMA